MEFGLVFCYCLSSVLYKLNCFILVEGCELGQIRFGSIKIKWGKLCGLVLSFKPDIESESWWVSSYIFTQKKRNQFNQRAVRFVLRDYRARKNYLHMWKKLKSHSVTKKKLKSQHLQVAFHLDIFYINTWREIK